MRVYAFAGPEHPAGDITFPLQQRLERMPEPDKVVTGAALGVDTVAFKVSCVLWPHAEQLMIYPSGFRYNYNLVRRVKGTSITVREGGTDKHLHPALVRNREIIEECTHLIAIPASLRPYRSGTWHAIREARRQHRKVYLLPVPTLLTQPLQGPT